MLKILYFFLSLYGLGGGRTFPYIFEHAFDTCMMNKESCLMEI